MGLTNDPNYKIGEVYITQVNLKVRSSASAENNSNWKKVKELTEDGKKNATTNNLESYAVLKTGTRVSLLNLKKENSNIWGQIPSGWIAFKYNGKVYVK